MAGYLIKFEYGGLTLACGGCSRTLYAVPQARQEFMGVLSSRFRPKSLAPLKITIIYAVIGGLWIILSDRFVASIAGDPAAISRLQTLKGWFYVVATATLLYLLISRTLSAVRQSEHALRESEQRYRSLFEASKDVIYISTPGGKLIDINPAGVELFGYSSKKEILTIDIPRDLYLHPEERETFRRTIKQKGYVENLEVTLKKRSGERLIMLLTGTAVRDEKGDIVAYRGFLRDITNQRRLEQQLFQSQKMEAIGQLAGGVAHDFNNILTAINSYGSLLQMAIEEHDPARTYIEQILVLSDRAAGLTQSLLAFSRKQIMNPRQANLNDVIRNSAKFLSRLIRENIGLTIIPAERELLVTADVGQLEQVMMNLATNARDAMPGGGTITVTTAFAVLGPEFIRMYGYGEPGEYALVTVSDTGVGMDEHTRQRIFEPFFTTKEVGKGTGLGLSIVYGIIKQHKGYINVHSEPGKGTIFNIYLPITGPKAEAKKEAPDR